MGYKILALDDELLFLDTLRESLKPYTRFELDTTTSPLDALAMVRKEPYKYAVILADQKMPGLSGSEVVTEMLKINPNLNIAMNSGHSGKDQIVECIRAGATDFFVKD